jgi:hypothetical protein
MKAISGRLRRLEGRLVPQENEKVHRAAAILRERRQRRLEAAGEQFEEQPQEVISAGSSRRLSLAETIRERRRIRLAELSKADQTGA